MAHLEATERAEVKAEARAVARAEGMEEAREAAPGVARAAAATAAAATAAATEAATAAELEAATEAATAVARVAAKETQMAAKETQMAVEALQGLEAEVLVVVTVAEEKAGCLDPVDSEEAEEARVAEAEMVVGMAMAEVVDLPRSLHRWSPPESAHCREDRLLG